MGGGGRTLLAHSPPAPGRDGQRYADHIGGVRHAAGQFAESMLQFAADPPPGLLGAVDAAATFHDLGKTDEEIQSAFRQGRSARLPWDHIDAGVAHLSASGNYMAAWLVRAHHAPGFPSEPVHFDLDGLGRRLRGRRNDDDTPDRHDAQISRTDEYLADYLKAHEAAVGVADPAPSAACHGLSLRLALSCLVDADHSDAACFDTGYDASAPAAPRWQDRLDRLDDYVANLSNTNGGDRDRHRKAFYAACRTAVVDDGMVACEGPVGLGKTTAVTAYLLRCAIRFSLRHIFVVAPYTNIISQTVERLRRALVLPGENPADVVAEHHHRADFQHRADRKLAVLWRAPIVVTTAVQFFETLASRNPARLRKLHELPGSAIFIDEAHAALPTALWPQNWLWLRELVEHWGCRIVFASGSLARFWENEDIVETPTELSELLPADLGRTVLQAEKRRIRYESLGLVETVDQLISHVSSVDGPRLVVLNTVQSAAVVAREMLARGCRVLHLSTALCPGDRCDVLERVQRLVQCPQINDWTLVATSCVEAGVELSFRSGFRERFGTANLIQLGGRINRHGEYNVSGGGVVYDFVIDSDPGGVGIAGHPAARGPAAVLKRVLRSGKLNSQDVTPAYLVTHAMADELRDLRQHGANALREAEQERDYPLVEEEGRVIGSDTQTVVVDARLRDRLVRRDRISARELLLGSVQIWAAKLDRFGLQALPGHHELYYWPYVYDPDFLGYMAGVLELYEIEKGSPVIV